MNCLFLLIPSLVLLYAFSTAVPQKAKSPFPLLFTFASEIKELTAMGDHVTLFLSINSGRTGSCFVLRKAGSWAARAKAKVIGHLLYILSK